MSTVGSGLRLSGAGGGAPPDAKIRRVDIVKATGIIGLLAFLLGTYFVPLRLPGPSSQEELNAIVTAEYLTALGASKCDNVRAVRTAAVNHLGPRGEERIRPLSGAIVFCDQLRQGGGEAAFSNCLGDAGRCVASKHVSYCASELATARACFTTQVDAGLSQITGFDAIYAEASEWAAANQDVPVESPSPSS